MSNTFNAENMAKLSTDSIESMKFIELEKCKGIILDVAKCGEREVFIDITHSVRTFVCTELEALGFKVEFGFDVRISW